MSKISDTTKESTLSKKMKFDNWREKDLYRIAEVCDCKYEGKFIL